MRGEELAPRARAHDPEARERRADERAFKGEGADEGAVLARPDVVAAVDEGPRQVAEIALEGGQHARHPAEHDLGVARVPVERVLGRFAPLFLVRPVEDEGVGIRAAVRTPVRPGRERLEEAAPLRVAVEGVALLRRPGKPDRVRPDEEGGVPGDGALAIREGHLDVALEPDRKVRPKPPRDLLREGPRRVHEDRGRNSLLAAVAKRDPGAGDPPARRQHPFHPAGDEERPVPARFLEEVHPELLRAEPAAAPRVEHRDRLR